MKIVSWNCNDKFSEKFITFIEENDGIYFIPECENLLTTD